jgi:hypothetical protein
LVVLQWCVHVLMCSCASIHGAVLSQLVCVCGYVCVCVNMHMIFLCQVLRGCSTDKLRRRCGGGDGTRDDACFSLVTPHRTLDLEVRTCVCVSAYE